MTTVTVGKQTCTIHHRVMVSASAFLDDDAGKTQINGEVQVIRFRYFMLAWAMLISLIGWYVHSSA